VLTKEDRDIQKEEMIETIWNIVNRGKRFSTEGNKATVTIKHKLVISTRFYS
jgi:hypothetical protein